MKLKQFALILSATAIWIFTVGTRTIRAYEVKLAVEGRALHPVVLAPGAGDGVKEAAVELARVLSRISGAGFDVVEGDGASGIAVGIFDDFDSIESGHDFDPEDAFRREEYLLRTHTDGIWLLGATESAVEHAVWDMLYRLGYRQFFPGDTWEVIPEKPTLGLAADCVERPDFYTRLIWYGHGLWDYNHKPYQQWCARNRTVRGFGLRTSHAYGAIIRRNRDVFDENPAFLALVDGERRGSKLCISNRALREWVIDNYALPYFRDNPEADCVSLEPSDGGGWCECNDCNELGSISDRVLLLANEAAEAINEEFPGKYVGLLAYSQHSPPPSIKVHPNVLIKVQTSFIRGNYTFDELMLGWQGRGARNIGVGDYYSVFSWDRSRPASQRGSDLARVRETIPRFHEHGARLFTCESSDLWGGIGLGHYLASRLLWDVSEAERAEEIIEDFMVRAFGPAREPMEGFFRLIYIFEEGERRPLIRSDMLARMYRFLSEAYELAGDDVDVIGRLDDLLLFTRYEDLYQRYSDTSGGARQEAVEELIRHAYRMRETMMVHAKPIVRSMRLSGRDRDVTDPDMEDIADDAPFSREELDKILAEGLEKTRTVELPFTPIEFSEELVPALPLRLPEVEPGNFGGSPMGSTRFYTYLEEPGILELEASGGHIKHYRDIASNTRVELYADADPTDDSVDYYDNIPPDGETYRFQLKSPYEGLHKLYVNPFSANRAIADTVLAGQPFTIYGGLEDWNRMTRFWSLYFYVPRGTEVVGGFTCGQPRGVILDGDGNEMFNFREDMEDAGYFHIDVPKGQDGRLWKFDGCMGRRALLTVPPYLARSEKELLLPREVVEADSD